MMGHFRAFDKMILRNLTFCFNLGIRCAVMGEKKNKHFDYSWLMLRNHTFAYLQPFKNIFSLYGTCHKTSKTVRSLSMSSE